MRDRKPIGGQIWGAWACLLAAVFLYAPLGAAAWSAHAMACCTGDHCPILQHHHRQIAPASPSSKPAHADCEHELSQGMNCSIACCENSEKPVVTPVAFTLPHTAAVFSPVAIVAARDAARTVEIPRSIKPLSPPPRFTHSL